MGHCSNGDAMFRFHRQEVFQQLLDQSHLLLRMRRRIILRIVQVQQIGWHHKMVIFGDELAQRQLLEPFFHSDHRVQCSDHVQVGIMFLQ